ncbi:MAG: phosphohistidine phosphatase SixA [Gemmatimonadetes bacterium]|nr:phosphohistidine phosphatase SixA [Gemmatimonadota bacterium]
MLVYLVQHGEAASEQEGPERPLTPRGRTEVSRVARAAARIGVQPEVIWHSDKLRARQTAELLAAELTPPESLRQVSGLAPKDDPATAAGQVAAAAAPVMLGGHLPLLSRLASLLLIGDPSKEVIAFRMGGMVALEGTEAGWRVTWMLTPETCV